MSKSIDVIPENLTAALAGFVVDLQPGSIPADQTYWVRASLLDWLGCCLAGAEDPAVQALDAVLGSMGGAPQATLVGRARRASVLDAALLNGAAGAQLDLDDLHVGLIGHPAAVLCPTLLALGEQQGAHGRDFVTAYVAGYEVLVRIGLAVEPELYNRGWHATGVLGVFGACAAAGKLLALDAAQMVAAMGIAGTQAAGLRELLGVPAKCLHQGKAAAAGVLAALWAKAGVTSCVDIIGGRHGLQVFSQPPRAGKMLDGMGERFLLGQTSYKRHAGSGSLHAAIDAALALRRDHDLTAEAIERVVVKTHPLAADMAQNHAEPATTFAARQSMHFAVALAFVEGRADADLYTDATLADARVRALAARVVVQADPEMQYVDAMPSQVSISMRDGRQMSARIDMPKGRPGNPMSWDELADKFRRLTASALPVDRQAAVIAAVARLDALAVADLLAPLAHAQAH
ncbi:MAG: MmgE/PrpD family protein [Burkholderiales bacterium]